VRKILAIMAAAAATGFCTPALAATIWFDDDHNTPDWSGDYPTGTSLTFSGGGVNVTATGWTISTTGTIARASLGVWDQGLGVKSSNDNSHTVDNSGGLDFVLFQFDKTVELDFASLQTGWADSSGNTINDTDATIGYHMNASIFGASPTLHALPKSTLDVMNLYGNGSAGNSGDSYRDINPLGQDGKLWLIGASFTEHNPDGWYKKKDGFKIEKLTFSLIPPPPPPPPPGGVPEPATWAMMLLGFFGLGGAMRSAKRRERAERGVLSDA
jgi:hypothetical protein